VIECHGAPQLALPAPFALAGAPIVDTLVALARGSAKRVNSSSRCQGVKLSAVSIERAMIGEALLQQSCSSQYNYHASCYNSSLFSGRSVRCTASSQ
jgi:hypothetical protein